MDKWTEEEIEAAEAVPKEEVIEEVWDLVTTNNMPRDNNHLNKCHLIITNSILCTWDRCHHNNNSNLEWSHQFKAHQ